MSDDVDLAQAREQVFNERALAAARAKAAEIPVGMAGECELCGEWSGRLVVGACAPCRDRFRLG